MKKFLSMVLALVMVMSLVTVSAGAKDFTDDEAITYEEAVAVVSEIGVVDGYTDGTFKPSNTLTRQAAAKIICNLKLGTTTAAELHADTAPYRDVPANNEFAGYIAYCQKEGIISGYADGSFRPGNPLTGYAFMKMLLGALGYDATLEQYVGDNWSINVAKQAIHIGLDDGIEMKEGAEFNGIKPVTREEACLYAFNTLQADLVEYGQRLTTNINGTEVTLSSGGAKSREWNSQQSRYDNIRTDNLIQFAEEYFNKLEKKADTDDFERPAHTWLYDKVEIGTYVDWDKLVERYTSSITGRDLYDLLTSTTIRDNDLVYYVNGLLPGSDNETATNENASLDGGDNILKKDLVRSNQDDLAITDNGVLTEVFLDKDKELITIVSINTWLAQAAGDYSESKEYAPMVVYFDGPSKRSTTAVTRTWNVDVEDVPSIVDVEEDDFRLVKISYKNNLKGDVVVVTEPEIMEDSTVTKFSQNQGSTGGGRVTKLTTGGTEYKRSQKAFYNDEILEEYNQSLLTDKTYNIFMDEYGFFIGVDLYEGTLNYVFITGFDRPTSNLSISTARANGIFLDGTMALMTVNVTDTDKNIQNVRDRHAANANNYRDNNAADYFVKWRDMPNGQGQTGIDGSYRYNRWFTYTQNADGVYTLTPATRMNAQKFPAAGTTIRTDNVYVTDNVLLNGTNPYAFAASGGTLAYAGVAGYGYGRTWNQRSYGNDDSVFITVSLDEVDTNNGPRAITEVDEVYTGVDNVEIEIENDINAQEAEVYTVFNRDGYIIGAVVIGEGKGSNATVAYVMSDAKSEEKKDDTYYWEFDAIIEGEIKTLTARSKYTTIFNTLLRENADHYDPEDRTPTSKVDNGTDGLVELRFDADGYVVNVKEVLEKNIYSFYGTRAATPQGGLKGETSHGDGANGVSTAIVDMSDVKAYRMNVIQAPFTDTSVSPSVAAKADSVPNTLELAGRTLYVTAGRMDEGLVIANGAKAVVTQRENNKGWVDSEFSSVDAALAHLADANVNADGLQYEGEIVAVVDGRGAATWVYFYNYSLLTTGNQGGSRFDLTDFEVRCNNANELKVLKDGGAPTIDEAMKAVSQWLNDNKGTVVDVKYVPANAPVVAHYEFTVEYTTGGLTYKTIYTMGITNADLVPGKSVNINGKPLVADDTSTTVDEGTSNPQTLATAAGLGTLDANTQVLVTTSKGQTFYCPVGSTFNSAATLAAGETIVGMTTGYIKVTLGADIFDSNTDSTGFYGNTSDSNSTSVKSFTTYYVKAKSDVTVNVTLGKRNNGDVTSVVDYTVTVTYTEGVTAGKTAAVDVAKNVREGSTVKVVLPKAATDVTITSVDLKANT